MNEQIENIRREQEAQIKGPRKPGQWWVQSLSNLLHPLLMLTYAALAICAFSPLQALPFMFKAFFVGSVCFYTLVMPVLAITLMHVFHLVGHWALRDRRDRALPFLVNFVCYAVNAFALSKFNFLPSWVLSIYYGSVVLTFVAWVVSFWWKISAHASADAATATMLLFLYILFPLEMPLWLVLTSIVLVGAVCSSRVYLGRHTLAQVGVGSLLGIVSMLLAWILFL